MKKNPLFSILLCVFGITLLSVICAILFLNTHEKEESHEYVVTVITDKYINEGFAGIYHYKDTEYILVSEYYQDNEKRVVSTVVEMSTYNYYNIDDKVFYCINHNRLKIYE